MSTGSQVMICGLDSAGKTTILRFIESGEFITTARTMGFNVNSISIKSQNFRIFDMGGQVAFRSMWADYLPVASAIVFVIDSSKPERFDEAKYELHDKVLKYSNHATGILILANKQDLENAKDPVEIRKALELDSFVDRDFQIVPTSAVTSEGLFQVGVWIYENISDEEYKEADPFEGLID